jgi:hypothetical protein
MGLRDKFEDMLASFRPKSRGLGGGIGSGHGMVPNDDVSSELLYIKGFRFETSLWSVCWRDSLFMPKDDLGIGSFALETSCH